MGTPAKKIIFAIFLLIITSTNSIFANLPSPEPLPTAETLIIPVLTYHRIIPKTTSIYDFTPEMLEEHFKLFRSLGYQTISAAEFITYQHDPTLFPKKPLVLTFDDGNKSHYTWAFPLLKKYGFHATFFIYPKAVHDVSELSLTWTELKEMSDDGFDIESHTLSHPYLSRSNITPGDIHSNTVYQNWLANELQCSKTIIETKLGKKISLLAYPFGWFDAIVESAAMKAGYQGIFTVNWGQNTPLENPFRIKRRVMDSTMDLASIEHYIEAKPLALEAITPKDTEIISTLPLIQFRIQTPGIHSVTVKVRNHKESLVPDDQGIYTFDKTAALKPGYIMVIVKGYDAQNNYYLGSWGFNYQVVLQPHTGNPSFEEKQDKK
jgi:peptidoglycan/xylan/chitin deacetylase (PgdA/CDA1 family)